MYAIIETGSKQYKVSEGDIIKIEKLDVNAGENFILENVLFLSKDGQNFFGEPNLKNVSVNANVVCHGKEKKVIVYKFKSKKRISQEKRSQTAVYKIKNYKHHCQWLK